MGRYFAALAAIALVYNCPLPELGLVGDVSLRSGISAGFVWGLLRWGRTPWLYAVAALEAAAIGLNAALLASYEAIAAIYADAMFSLFTLQIITVLAGGLLCDIGRLQQRRRADAFINASRPSRGRDILPMEKFQ